MAKLIWITGLSGSGKTTIAKKVFQELRKMHTNVIFLDGDDFREILGNDLGYTLKDRIENAKRIHRMCNFLISQDINVICATMSLYKEIHKLNREVFKNYLEVFIECSMEELIKRDQKGLYSKAINRDIDNVIGINIAFDRPTNCDLVVENTELNKLDEKVQRILELICIEN